MALWQPINENLVTQLKGTVIRRGTTPNNVLLALADTPENSAELLGVRIDDIASGATGLVVPFITGAPVRLAAEPNLGDTIYLSATTSGIGTNAAPALPRVLGYVYEKFQVATIWYGRLLPSYQTLFGTGSSSSLLAYIEKTANYTLKPSDGIVNCTANSFTITLPSASGMAGKPYIVTNSGTGTITVLPNGIEKIAGMSRQIVDPGNSMSIVSTGAGWIIV
jgi:hypothetical protein